MRHIGKIVIDAKKLNDGRELLFLARISSVVLCPVRNKIILLVLINYPNFFGCYAGLGADIEEI